MTGMTRTSADLDVRRRKVLFRAWHRGIREMDLVMGGFADAAVGALSESELGEFEVLLDLPDTDLIKWVTGEQPVPAAYDTNFFRRMAAHRPDFAPITSNET